MCGHGGIGTAVHEGFNEIVNRSGTDNQSDFLCQYVTAGAPVVNTRLYIWEKNGVPFLAYSGTVDYTQGAFSDVQSGDLLSCATAFALSCFNDIEPKTMYCTHSEIEENILILPTHPILEEAESNNLAVRGA